MSGMQALDVLSDLLPILKSILHKIAAGDFSYRWTIQQVLANVKDGRPSGSASGLEAASSRLGLLCCTMAANLDVAHAIQSSSAPDQIQEAAWQVPSSLLLKFNQPIVIALPRRESICTVKLTVSSPMRI